MKVELHMTSNKGGFLSMTSQREPVKGLSGKALWVLVASVAEDDGSDLGRVRLGLGLSLGC